jgi:hypothetical protein
MSNFLIYNIIKNQYVGVSHQSCHNVEETMIPHYRKIISENNEINDKLNKNAQDMIAEIDTLLMNSESINTTTKITEAEDINLEDIEGIDAVE